MRICFSLTNLELGGAQIFVLRLANELAEQLKQPVYIYDHWPEHRNKTILKNNSPRVKIISFCENAVLRWCIWKLNGVFKVLGIHSNVRYKLNQNGFLKAVKKYQFTVVNSHMSYSDFVISEKVLPQQCKLVLTLHGEYEMLLQEQNIRDMSLKNIKQALSATDSVVYTADKNLTPLKLPEINYTGSPVKINIGFSETQFKILNISRKKLGYTQNDFVVGMVSRGIPEKGWDISIRCIQKYNQTHTQTLKLILIGDGAYLKDLVKQVNDPAIRLIQFEENFQDYFSYYSLFNLFLFPSQFKGESFPNVVIESLYWQIPVLSVRHAEIPNMLNAEGTEPAGRCVEMGSEEDIIASLGVELHKLVSEPETLKHLRENCKKAFLAFNMQEVAQNYLQVFKFVSC